MIFGAIFVTVNIHGSSFGKMIEMTFYLHKLTYRIPDLILPETASKKNKR